MNDKETNDNGHQAMAVMILSGGIGVLSSIAVTCFQFADDVPIGKSIATGIGSGIICAIVLFWIMLMSVPN